MIDIKLPQPKGTKIKICPYCNEQVYYKETDLSLIDECGYGFFCRLCGGFIEAHVEAKPSNKQSYSSRRRLNYSYRSHQKKQERKLCIFLIVSIIAFIPLLIYALSFTGLYIPNVQSESTFRIICNETGYDMSDQIPISLSVPKAGVEFNSEIDLWIISNYYLLIDSQFPIDIEVDIRSFKYILIEINPNYINPNYSNKVGIYPANINYNFCFYASYNISYIITEFGIPYLSYLERF